MFLVSAAAYSHTQIGYGSLIGTAAGCIALIVAALFLEATGRQLPRGRVIGGFAIAIVLLLATGATFSRMTIAVGNGSLTWNFALGLLRHDVPLTRIADASVVQNTSAEGFGIHNTSDGTLYNVAGSWSIRLRLDDGSSVRLGTDEPAVLLRAIQASKP